MRAGTVGLGVGIIALLAPLASHAQHDHDHLEDEALSDLVSTSDATHTAAVSGDWASPSTWGSGVVPGAGARVHIPHGIVVRYNVDSTAALDWVRVDGRLSFATQQSTRLRLDTLAVMGGGRLVIGTAAEPIAAEHQAMVEFVDNGPILRADDPLKLGRGLVVRGALRVFGAQKTPYTTSVGALAAGTTTIELSTTPYGWSVGDRIVIAGTRVPELVWNGAEMVWSGTRDEVRTIVGTDGTTLNLDTALAHHHAAPTAALRPYVANLSRNVVFATVDGEAVEFPRRAHAMLMHNDDAQVQWAAFRHMGRTDKSRWTDDPGTDPIRERYGSREASPDPTSWDADTDEGTNPRGRYSLHVHMSGAQDPFSDPVAIRGCVVEGSPGWGFVSHDSHVVMEDNVAFDVFGSAFVTEIGNELGAFRRNMAIRGEGDFSRHFKEGIGNHDLAFNGIGFWFQGRNIVVEDNVAISQSQAGFFYFHRSSIENPYLPLDAMRYPFIGDRGRALSAASQGRINFDRAPIRSFRNNIAIATGTALEVVKNSPHQEHDQRNLFENLVGWHVGRGINLEYTALYTFLGATFIRDPQADGGDWAESPSNQWAPWAIHFGNNSDDMTLIDVEVYGWRPELRLNAFDNSDNPHGWFERTRIDVVGGNLPTVDDRPIVTGATLPGGDAVSSYHPDFHFYYDTHDPQLETAFVVEDELEFVAPSPLNWTDSGSFFLEGTKHDSVGPIGVRHRWHGEGLRHRIENEGAYEHAGSYYLLLNEHFFDRASNQHTSYPFALDVTDSFSPQQHSVRGALPADDAEYFANTPPEGAADAYTVPAFRQTDVPAELGVLANDHDPDGDVLRVEHSRIAQPAHGVVSVQPNGAFTYIPDPNFVGADSFTYVVSDGVHEAEPTPVTLTVEAGAPPIIDDNDEDTGHVHDDHDHDHDTDAAEDDDTLGGGAVAAQGCQCNSNAGVPTMLLWLWVLGFHLRQRLRPRAS